MGTSDFASSIATSKLCGTDGCMVFSQILVKGLLQAEEAALDFEGKADANHSVLFVAKPGVNWGFDLKSTCRWCTPPTSRHEIFCWSFLVSDPKFNTAWRETFQKVMSLRIDLHLVRNFSRSCIHYPSNALEDSLEVKILGIFLTF